MFERTAYSDPGFCSSTVCSIEALAALSALLDLALKDPNAISRLLSGASRASHDQNRGETHVTRDDKLQGKGYRHNRRSRPQQQMICSERPVERRHRRAPAWPELPAEARASAHKPDDAVDPRPCCDDSDATREGG